jgi:3-oxoacyl-[acyl-carrier protein] reductase
MTDLYSQFTGTQVGRLVTGRLGLPQPPKLRRYEPGQPLLEGPAYLPSGPGGEPAAAVLTAAGAEVRREDDGQRRYGAVVLDTTDYATVPALARLRSTLGPVVRRVLPSGRVIVLARPVAAGEGPEAAATRAALDGFVRSLAKELRGGATANLLRLEAGADDEASLSGAIRFFASARSAYVDGQSVRLSARPVPATADWRRPLDGRLALVTGAARGIGAAIAEVLARDGADVICLDVPAHGDRLTTVANRIGGSALQLDITASDAPARLARYLRDRHGGPEGAVDVVVHNAGITRDRTLANMSAVEWDSVLAVNLTAQLRINATLVDGLLRRDGRVVCLSSTSGIAGNRGQTNYAASKAGILGMVAELAGPLADRGSTINAVAPGFIETDMTAAMPFAVREVGRRINSMNQGGLPADVAETVAWLAQPGSAPVTGQAVRVCGQSMVGA